MKSSLCSSVSNDAVPNFLNENSSRIFSKIGIIIVVNTEIISRSTSFLFSAAIINPSLSETINASTSRLISIKFSSNVWK